MGRHPPLSDGLRWSHLVPYCSQSLAHDLLLLNSPELEKYLPQPLSLTCFTIADIHIRFYGHSFYGHTLVIDLSIIRLIWGEIVSYFWLHGRQRTFSRSRSIYILVDIIFHIMVFRCTLVYPLAWQKTIIYVASLCNWWSVHYVDQSSFWELFRYVRIQKLTAFESISASKVLANVLNSMGVENWLQPNPQRLQNRRWTNPQSLTSRD